MRILLIHNRYQQRGGEDAVFEAESALLRDHGHDVLEFVKDNRDSDSDNRVRLAVNAIWSQSTRGEIAALMRQHRPDVAHFHNTHIRISPAAYYTVREYGVPVVQTLHNFRLICPSATFFRDEKVCEDCLGKAFAWPGVRHACYRDSRSASITVATNLTIHRALGTWTKQVDRYLALTNLAKAKFVEGGLPEEKIVVKPNFAPDRRCAPNGTRSPRTGALYVGRLSKEKGLLTLIQAWRGLAAPLTVVGDGPLYEVVSHSDLPYVQALGRKSAEEVAIAMHQASFLVMPSEWYEGFALVLVESFCQGLPVIASRLGAMAEIVEDGVTGLHFAPGNSKDLAAKVRWAHERPDEMLRMGENARKVYEEKYSPDANYPQLMRIYEEAIEAKQTRRTKLGSP